MCLGSSYVKPRQIFCVYVYVFVYVSKQKYIWIQGNVKNRTVKNKY